MKSNMATLSATRRAFSLLQRSLFPVRESFLSARTLSVSSYKGKEDSEGLISKILGLGSVEKATDAHSKVLTERETLYEFECKSNLAKTIT